MGKIQISESLWQKNNNLKLCFNTVCPKTKQFLMEIKYWFCNTTPVTLEVDVPSLIVGL